MNLVINIISILLIVNILVFLGKKIKIPPVISLIISGLIINLPPLREYIGLGQSLTLSLSNIGFITLMFLAGFEISWRILYKEKKRAAIVGTFGFFIPFISGFLIFLLFGFRPLTALLIGLCMSISAEATRAKVLLDLKKIETKIGATLMGAGIVDDILGLTSLSIILLFISGFSIGEIWLTLSAILAFFLGVYINNKIGREKTIIKIIEKTLLIAIIPFFFISIGFHFEFQSLIINPILLVLIVAVAILGKIISVLLTKPFTNFNFKQLFLIGWAMNSRGAIEFAIALIIFRLGLISTEVYSAIIVMAIITTLIFPFIITRLIKKNPGIMNE